VGKLFDTIRRRVRDRRYVVGQHAAERLEERGFLEWQVVDGIVHAKLQKERPRDQPNPAVEVLQTLPDGTEVEAVWSYIKQADIAKLVTVYYLDE
jgi:hypothetical protein